MKTILLPNTNGVNLNHFLNLFSAKFDLFINDNKHYFSFTMDGRIAIIDKSANSPIFTITPYQSYVKLNIYLDEIDTNHGYMIAEIKQAIKEITA